MPFTRRHSGVHPARGPEALTSWYRAWGVFRGCELFFFFFFFCSSACSPLNGLKNCSLSGECPLRYDDEDILSFKCFWTVAQNSLRSLFSRETYTNIFMFYIYIYLYIFIFAPLIIYLLTTVSFSHYLGATLPQWHRNEALRALVTLSASAPRDQHKCVSKCLS